MGPLVAPHMKAEQPRWIKMDIFDRRTFAYIFWVVQIGEQLHTLLFYLILMGIFFCQTVKPMEGFLRNTIDSRIGRIWQDRGPYQISQRISQKNPSHLSRQAIVTFIEDPDIDATAKSCPKWGLL